MLLEIITKLITQTILLDLNSAIYKSE